MSTTSVKACPYSPGEGGGGGVGAPYLGKKMGESRRGEESAWGYDSGYDSLKIARGGPKAGNSSS